MRHLLLKLLAFGLISALTVNAGAQEAGFYNSPKGFGAQLRMPVSDGVSHCATAMVDIYGIPTSRCSSPGLRFNFSRMYEFSRIETPEVVYSFHAGPGISAGYVRDHVKGRGFDLTSLISENPGFMLALSGDIGCRFDFGGRISLNLSFLADIGFHVRRDEAGNSNAANLSVYNNGLIQTFYPQLTFLYRLK